MAILAPPVGSILGLLFGWLERKLTRSDSDSSSGEPAPANRNEPDYSDRFYLVATLMVGIFILFLLGAVVASKAADLSYKSLFSDIQAHKVTFVTVNKTSYYVVSCNTLCGAYAPDGNIYRYLDPTDLKKATITPYIRP